MHSKYFVGLCVYLTYPVLISSFKTSVAITKIEYAQRTLYLKISRSIDCGHVCETCLGPLYRFTFI